MLLNYICILWGGGRWKPLSRAPCQESREGRAAQPHLRHRPLEELHEAPFQLRDCIEEVIVAAQPNGPGGSLPVELGYELAQVGPPFTCVLVCKLPWCDNEEPTNASEVSPSLHLDKMAKMSVF